MMTSLSDLKQINSLGEYSGALTAFNWFHDREMDFSAWAADKNELMYLRGIARESSHHFRRLFNLHWCANYGVGVSHAPFCTSTDRKEGASVTLVEVEALQRELGLPELQPTRQEGWR